jgi:SAM-dependent methyltransferase
MLFRQRFTADVIRREIGGDTVVVELGGADFSFRELVPAARWLVVDKFGAPDIRIDFESEDLRMPFDSGSIDVFICTEVLEHLRSGRGLVREMARCLRADGAAYISVPNLTSLGARLKWFAGRVPFMAASGDCGHPLGGTGVLSEGKWCGGHVVDFNDARLRGYLERDGLKVDRSYSLGAKLRFETLRLPPWLTPVTLSDFIFVRARRDHRQHERSASS